ncbi:hypothetical protein GSI_09314 [Ganoderma sinense ZZ0214-1]|uniref:Uncharacterized protein n=1 Tax=Ganoderma sinense ZZ0214-1 TaxID=1077348 RepID=A0A2G8S6A4_9APHY|nr:hypothetical protein GSI_09314 [Ganoderma sinense ZZ0214-1]
MQNALPSEAFTNRKGHAPTHSAPTRNPTTHRTTQPLPNSPVFASEQTPEHRVDADLMESILIDAKARVDLLLDDSKPTVLPLSRKVFREAVACGLLKLVRDPTGRVVQVMNPHSHSYQGLSTEDINALLDLDLSPDAQPDDYSIGSSAYSSVTGSDPGSWSCVGDSDVDVNWAAVFNSSNDGLNLAERGETMHTTWVALDGGRADGAMNTFVQGPGRASRRYGGGSAAAQL